MHEHLWNKVRFSALSCWRMRTFQWLLGMEVMLHALNTGIQLLNAIDNEREILQYEPTGSRRVLGPGFLSATDQG